MDAIREFLEAVRAGGLLPGHFRGLLHVLIGRKVTRPDGSVVSAGLTWRELAGLLKLLRFDRELVREYGADPDTLAPRDRERFWYSAIAQAKVDSREAVAEGDRLVGPLKGLGYVVGPVPAGVTFAPPPRTAPRPTEDKPKPAEEKPARRKKKG